MATVVNFIDTTLQAAAARGVNLPTADIQLLPSAPLFKVAPDGSITPPSITFTATLIDLEADLTFNATGAPLTSPTAKSVTVVGESMTGSSVTVIASATVNGRNYTKPYTITKVQDGSVGSTTYTWIKYADSAAGAGLSDDPTGKPYIGLAYNKPSPIESVIASDYTWSLIKGEDGVPGQPGKDGVQLFTWIKYSNSADGAGLYDQPTADTLYIGIAVNKTTATESSNPADYVWSRFKGDQGVPGPALYTWIKYADSAAGAGLSDDPAGKAYIGFAYNKTTAVEGENPADYTWSLNQGGQGVPGQPGKDGQTLYTWIKYADAPDGTGLYDVPNASTTYIGIAVNKVTATESTNKADYTWSKFRGDQGVPGNPGQPGQRGTVDISAGTAGTVWSDSEATAAIAQTGYGVPQMLDVVTLYNQAAGFANTRYWNGSAWIAVSQVINGSLLVKNTVAADKIDTRGLSIKDTAGNTILAAGSALSKDYAAPGTLNSEQQWTDVKGPNRPQDNATVGANADNFTGTVGGDNLTPNSSFERSSDGAIADGYYVYNHDGVNELAVAYRGSGRSGGQSQVIAWNNNHRTVKGIYGRVNRNGWIPGKTYVISWYALTTNLQGPADMFLAWNTWPDSVTPLSNPLISTSWQRYAFRITWGSSVEANGNAYISLGYGDGAGNVVFDDLMVVEGDVLPAYYTSAAEAAETADWGKVGGSGKPQDNATIGAPSGTMVGGTDAGLVASRAMNGDAAYNALPGITQQIADRLSKTSPSELAATVTLATNGTLLAGTPDNGVYMTPVGLYCVQGGVVKVAIPISGDPTFAGRLIAAAGTLGSLRLAANGSIASGDFTGWAWPDSRALGRPVVGFYLGPEGFITGDYYAGKSWQFTSDGNVYAPGFRIVNGQVYVDSPIITNPKVSTAFNMYLPQVYVTGQANGSTVTISIVPVISNGSGNYTYQWSFSGKGPSGSIYVTGSIGGASLDIAATGSRIWREASASLTIRDNVSGATATAPCDIQIQFGDGVIS